jgi:hypothetical protein
MRGIELYRAILRLTAPSTVAKVDLDAQGWRVVRSCRAAAEVVSLPAWGIPAALLDLNCSST